MGTENLSDKLGRCELILALSEIKNIDSSITNLIEETEKRKIPCAYLNINRSTKGIITLLKKQGIIPKRVLFVDCISSSSGETHKPKNTIFIDSASNIDSIRQMIYEFVDEIEGRKVVIIDALATLLIYNLEEEVFEFIKGLSDRMDDDMTAFVFTPKTRNERFTKEISPFFDRVIHV